MRPSRNTRGVLRQVHLWMGLVLGLPFAVIAATGLPVTYWYASDALFAPGYYAGTISKPRASFDALAASARKAVPTANLQSVVLLPDYGTAQAALTLSGGKQREVSLDAATGRVIGVRSLDDAAISWLYSVHTRLALDRAGLDLAGRIAVMLLAAMFVVLALSGVILWWPRSWRWRVLAPTIRPRHRWLDLHNKSGIYALVPVALAAATTLLLEFPATRTLGGEIPPVVAFKANPGAQPLEQLARLASAATPGRPLLGVFGIEEPVPLQVTTGDEWGGYRWITVDRRTGRLLLISSSRPRDLPGPPDASFLISLHQGHR